MTDLLSNLSDLRDSAEDVQTYARLAQDEMDPDKRAEWRRKARMAMGAVRMKATEAERVIAGWV